MYILCSTPCRRCTMTIALTIIFTIKIITNILANINNIYYTCIIDNNIDDEKEIERNTRE